MKQKNSEKAITLIALVITIIVLLILASISVAVIAGRNGIIERAKIAKEITKIEEYREDLQLIGEGLQPDKVIEQLTSKEYMDRYEEEIKKDERYEKVKRKDDETIRVTTKEGYVYIITTEKVEYIGKEGEIIPPNLQESDIEFVMQPKEWTNKEVTVEIEKKNEEIEGFILQYSIDGVTWKNYTEPIIVKDNGAVYARLVNNIGDTGGYATGNIENIDKLAPNNFTPTTTSTTNSITITGSTQDQEKTETDGSSGIAKYYFSIDNGLTWEPENGQTGTSYTFSNLTQNKTYSLKMKAIDNAGNETTTETVSKETGTVPGLIESNITFTSSPSTWTKGSVNVTISTTVTGYTLQYSTDGSNWNNYTAAINRTDNGAIYARLWDGTNAGGYATGNIENIDKLAPNNFTPTATSTTNSITLTGSTQDQEKTETDGSSGIAKYYFSNDNGVTWLPTDGQTSTSYTFSNLTQNKTYSLKMKAVDNAENETITETVSKETGTVPGLTQSNITFTNSPRTWTKGSVNVTISTTVTGYTLQYSTNGTNWNNYTTPINRTDNGAIYARLWDGTNAGGYATGNVENIDRLAPNNFIPTATSTTNSITLTGSTQDQAKTTTNGSSGISKYYFSIDNGSTWVPENGQTTTSYTFSKLTQNKTYSLKMKAVDNAGNETTTGTVSKETETVPGLTQSNITFTNSPSTWTKENVNVTISTIVTGYTLQYSTDGSNWNNYTTALTRTENGAIYARLWDGTNAGGYATGNVTNIDKELPTVAIETNGGTYTVPYGSTTTNISTKITATDTGGSGLNILQYQFSTATTIPKDDDNKWKNFTNNGTITESLSGGTYYLYTKVIDKAENRAVTIQKSNKYVITAATGITQNPSNQTVVEGNPVTFNMGATGEGTINYQWYYQTTNSNTGGTAISGATSSSYTITSSSMTWNGRYLYCVATSSTNGSIATTTAALLTVQEAYYSITKSGKTINYNNLATAHADAVSGATADAGGTITVIKNVTDNSSVTIDKKITLNTNGKTITRSTEIATSANADIIINGNGKITSSSKNGYVIKNKSGKVTIGGPTISGRGGIASTGGTVNFNSGSIIADGQMLNLMDSSNGTISNGNFSGDGEFARVDSGSTLVMKGGTCNTTYQGITVYEATFSMSGGSITSDSLTIDNIGTCTISGGTILSTDHNVVQNRGVFRISNGNIKGNSVPAFVNETVSGDVGTLTMTGGRIETTSNTTYAITNSGTGTVSVSAGTVPQGILNTSSGNVVVTGGTIGGSNQTGIYNSGTGTITVGNASAAISTSNPSISGTVYGVYIKSGKFYFYNGILKGVTKGYYGTMTGKRSGATLSTGTSGSYKTAYFR